MGAVRIHNYFCSRRNYLSVGFGRIQLWPLCCYFVGADTYRVIPRFRSKLCNHTLLRSTQRVKQNLRNPKHISLRAYLQNVVRLNAIIFLPLASTILGGKCFCASHNCAAYPSGFLHYFGSSTCEHYDCRLHRC